MREVFQRLSPGAPYFPATLVGIQSGLDSMVRHVWMTGTVCLAKELSAAPAPLRILEIGSWAGHSALTWAEAVGKFDRRGSLLCIDPWSRYIAAPDLAPGTAYSAMDGAVDLDLIYGLFLHNASFADRSTRVDHMRGLFADLAPYLGDRQ